MRRHATWLGAMAIGAIAIGCGGGNDRGQTTEGTTGTSGAANVAGGQAMTLRGCVEAGSPPGTYVLRTTGSGEGERGGTAGTSGSGGGSGANVSGTRREQPEGVPFRLIATGNLDIGKNLGKEVTVSGELANRAQEGTGGVGTGGSAGDQTRRRQGGEGDVGTDLQSGSSQGSGAGRIQGSASDQYVGGQFFRVTSLTKVSDACSGTEASESEKARGRQKR